MKKFPLIENSFICLKVFVILYHIKILLMVLLMILLMDLSVLSWV